MECERTIEQYLVAKAKRMGYLVRKLQWIAHRGAPDRVLMRAGKVIWVELKSFGRRPEPHQEREHARMRGVGMRVEVIDSKEKVDEMLRDPDWDFDVAWLHEREPQATEEQINGIPKHENWLERR